MTPAELRALPRWATVEYKDGRRGTLSMITGEKAHVVFESHGRTSVVHCKNLTYISQKENS